MTQSFNNNRLKAVKNREQGSGSISIIRDTWRQADQSAKTILQQLTLQDLCQQRLERERLSNTYYI